MVECFSMLKKKAGHYIWAKTTDRVKMINWESLLNKTKLITTIMNRTVGIVLVVIGIVFGVLAYRTHDANTADLKIGKLELSAEKKSDSTEYIYWGLAGVALFAGIVASVAGKK